MRLLYAEQFGIEPQNARPTLRWWYRWTMWRTAQAQRDAMRYVSEHGLAQASPEQRRLYDSLVLTHD